jgi:hypothetical protein
MAGGEASKMCTGAFTERHSLSMNRPAKLLAAHLPFAIYHLR